MFPFDEKESFLFELEKRKSWPYVPAFEGWLVVQQKIVQDI